MLLKERNKPYESILNSLYEIARKELYEDEELADTKITMKWLGERLKVNTPPQHKKLPKQEKTVPGASKSICNRLPDDHSFLLRKEHGTVGDAEGVVECRYVAQGRVHAVLAERMNVNLCKAGSLLVADVLAPDRSI